MSITVKSG